MPRVSIASFGVAVAFFVGALTAPALVRLNLLLYERIGARGLRRFWGDQVPWWVPTVRATCAILGAVFLLRAIRIL